MFERGGTERVQEQELRRMLGMVRHRGPDEFGVLVDGAVGMGNARLSIIDLGGGSQPIANEDETLWIVFNGEIFNYLELRAALEAKGHAFRTATDTEVILHLFEERGPECLNALNGQFAFAIWDRQRRRLFLARDRLGVRPLFYAQTASNTFLFGSEIKTLLATGRLARELDPAMVAQVFEFWGPPTPGTVFRGIRELSAGHYLWADERSVEVKRYWSNRFPLMGEAGPEGGLEPTVEAFRALLTDACRLRLRADVPVGAYLSGGLDSSAIAALIRRCQCSRLATFSIAFKDEQFDESAFQRQMAAQLGTEHHVVMATDGDIGEAFPEVVWHAEVPLMRTAPVPMYLLSRLVRQQGYKVVLTGEGADEFLGGYDIFKEERVRRFWARQPHSKWRARLLGRLYGDIAGFGQAPLAMLEGFFGNELSQVQSPWYSHLIRWQNNRRTWRFLERPPTLEEQSEVFKGLACGLPEPFSRWEPLARAQYLEITLFMSQYLLSSQGDRMAMAHGVEGRFPFLDVRVVEFCNALPGRLKLRGLREKWLLREAARPWLPPSICERRKRPYRAPVHRSFFGTGSPAYVTELLSAQRLQEGGLFKAGAVEQLLGKLRSGAALGETDDMALAGILSTQLLEEQFVRHFRAAEPVGATDRVKVCRLS